MKFTYATFVSLMALVMTTASAQEPPPKSLPDLTSIQSTYRKELQAIRSHTREKVGDLRRSYLAALHKRESDARKARNLDRLVVVREEIKRMDQDRAPGEFSGPHPEEVADLRETWNEAYQTLQREQNVSIRELNLRLIRYAGARRDNLVETGDMNAALRWREWERELAENLPGKPDPTDSDDGPASLPPGIPHRLVIWNCHHAQYASRGSKKAHLRVFYRERKVWSKKNIVLAWEPDKAVPTEISIQVPAFDRLELEIVEWHKNGAGLSEIEIYRGENKKLSFASVTADSTTEAKYNAKKLTDGIKNSDKVGVGYWLPDFRTPATLTLEMK